MVAQFLGALYAAGIILGGALRFFPVFPPMRPLWLLQLTVSELGFLLAVPLLFMAFLTARRRDTFSPISILSPIALVLALLPIFETIGHERDWVWDLDYGAGRDAKVDGQLGSPYLGPLAHPLFRFMDFFQIPIHPLAIRENFQTPDGAKLPIYVYLSAAGKGGAPRPWILSIHGGGWSSGDPRDLDQTYQDLLEAGYNVVAPAYRFSPTYAWPRQETDVETAYQYAVKNAARFSLDPDQVWLLGRSAGGQIALKLAYASKVVTGVRGVIALYAPTDLDFGYRWAEEPDVLNSRQLLRDLIGTTPDMAADKYRDASPLADVGPNVPPTLLLTGRADPLVWYRHAHRLADALKAAKVRVVHLELPWATHGFDYFPNSPGGQVARNAILRFIANK